MTGRTTKSIKVLEIGRYFIHLANQDKKPITNKKLQKLVYYAQAWSLVLNDKKIFNEQIEAWVHGPAVRSLYVQYKNFGFNPITEDVADKDVANIPKQTKELLDEIWRVYGKLDAGYLEMLTHSERPWQEARSGLQNHENSENEITPKAMKSFYSEKLEQIKRNDEYS